MKSTYAPLYCVVAIAILFGQFLELGANSSLLSAASSEFALLAAGACLCLEPSARMKRTSWAATGPLLLLCAAIAWALIAAFVPLHGDANLTPDRLLLELVKLAALAVLVLLGAQIGAAPRGLRLAVSWMLWVGVAYLLLSLWLWRDNPTAVWGHLKGRHIDRFTATMFNANAAACVCATVTLLGLAQLHTILASDRRLQMVEDWAEAAVAATAVLLGIFATFLTASRTVGVVLVVFAVIQALATQGRRRGKPVRRILIVAGLGALAVSGAIALSGALTLDRPFTPEDSHVRLAGYRIAWDLFVQQPLFGYGLGSYRQLNQAHLPPVEADYLWDLGAAHQPILQAALEGGAPFAICLFAAVGWLTVQASRGLLRRAEGRDLALGVMLAAGLIMATAQVDIALNVPAVASLVMLLLGLAWGWSLNSAPDERPKGDRPPDFSGRPRQGLADPHSHPLALGATIGTAPP